MRNASTNHVAQLFGPHQTWLHFVPRQITYLRVVGELKVGNPHQPDQNKHGTKYNSSGYYKQQYLCWGSSMNGMLNNLFETGSGPSSSSTRNPNSSTLKNKLVSMIYDFQPGCIYLYSGCSLGSSDSLALFSFKRIS